MKNRRWHQQESSTIEIISQSNFKNLLASSEIFILSSSAPDIWHWSKLYFHTYLHVCTWACLLLLHVEAREQPGRVSSLLPPCGSQGSNSGYRGWWQANFTGWAISSARVLISPDSKTTTNNNWGRQCHCFAVSRFWFSTSEIWASARGWVCISKRVSVCFHCYLMPSSVSMQPC